VDLTGLKGICAYSIPPAKDHELRQAVKDYEAQLQQVTQSLAEYKHRAHSAEVSSLSLRWILC